MNIQLFKPYALQKQFIDRFGDTKDLFGVVVAPRGSGKTLLGINLLLYWLLSNPRKKGGWISPTFAQAKSVLDQIVSTSTPVIESSNRMEATITFINGSTIKFLSADSADNIRGFRFTHLVLDEVAYMKETVLSSTILPTLNPSGEKCLMISTPKGKNHFYNWYMKRETVSMTFPLTECPYVKQELIDEAQKSLPPELFKQEFLAQFVDSSNDVFTGVDRVSTVGAFSREKRHEVYVGIDTGLTSDLSVMTLISPIGRVLWVEAMNNQSVHSIANTFLDILDDYTVLGGYVESNGIGKAMADIITQKYRKIKELFMTQNIKQDLVRKLLNDIETQNIELPIEELLPQLHEEMVNYTYKMSSNGNLSFSHAPGHHDDYVDSLMMANYSRVKFMEKKPITVGSYRQVKPTWGIPQ